MPKNNYKCVRCGDEGYKDDVYSLENGRFQCLPHGWQPIMNQEIPCEIKDGKLEYPAFELTSTLDTQQDIIELQLLVIDLGDSCVVKVEKAEKPVWVIGAEIAQGDSFDFRRNGFDDIRAAIDAMDEKPPVPRLVGPNAGGMYVIATWKASEELGMPIGTLISQRSYDALSELAGHPLPIYEPKKGEWQQILIGNGFMPETISIWRYTKMK